MTDFKVGDKVRIKGNHPYILSLNEGAVTTVVDNVSFPLYVQIGDETLWFSLSEVEWIEPKQVFPTALERIDELVKIIEQVRDRATEAEVKAPEGIARAKGILEGLHAARVFVEEDELPHEEREILEQMAAGRDY